MLNPMDVTFSDDDLDRLEVDETFTMGYQLGIVKAYRRRLHIIRNAPDERDFYALKSLHYEKLKGDRQHQRSMRLNDQMRLIIEITENDKSKLVCVIGIENYH